MKIGTKFVLWHTEFKQAAYVDQMGIAHNGHLVLEEIPVTVTEVKKVPNMWTGEMNCEGWKAVSATGEEFTCNWTKFPSDSMTPTIYWDVRKDARGLWQPEDAVQVRDYGVYVDEKGNKVTPLGCLICTEHDVVFIAGQDDCWRCRYKIAKGEAR